VVTGVEMFKKQLDEGLAGDNAGLLLARRCEGRRRAGMVLAKGGSITPHTTFQDARFLHPDQGEADVIRVLQGYRPQFYLRTTDVRA